jgi:dipeptidase D
MSNAIENLQPSLLWQNFATISKIPRPSKHEEKVGDYIIERAKNLGYTYKVDSIGNVVVLKMPSKGSERTPVVILQGHTDMVCEKNSDVRHDFMKDPITLVRSNGYIKAQGTTLGSDNGVGVSAILAVMEDASLIHGPLELLFTVDEETGLTGAANLKPDFLKGRTLLNLDSEEEGTLYVGCAGGQDTLATIPLEFEKTPANHTALTVAVRGLKGGHSGVDIHLGRANAIKLLTRVLWKLHTDFGARLVQLEGGSKRNALPREAEAVVAVPKKSLVRQDSRLVDTARKAALELQATFANEFSGIEQNITVAVSETPLPKKVMKKKIQERILQLLYALPHGVTKMSADIPGLVETSTNLATVQITDKAVVIGTSQRSSVDSEKSDIVSQVSAACLLAGAKVEHSDGYPGWKPNMQSKALTIAKSTYKRLFGKEPEVKAIHAGLECGIIGEKYPGIDMISFGPTIEGAHSPDERVHIESVEKFWRYLVEMLKELAK